MLNCGGWRGVVGHLSRPCPFLPSDGRSLHSFTGRMGILFRLGPIFNAPILDKIMFPLPHRGWEACLGAKT